MISFSAALSSQGSTRYEFGELYPHHRRRRWYQPDQFQGHMQLWSIDDDKTFGPVDAVDALAACFGQSGGQVERLHLHPRAVGRKAVGHFGVFQRVAEAKIWPLVLKHIEAKVPLLRPGVGVAS
jgi:hypothetical protein